MTANTPNTHDNPKTGIKSKVNRATRRNLLNSTSFKNIFCDSPDSDAFYRASQSYVGPQFQPISGSASERRKVQGQKGAAARFFAKCARDSFIKKNDSYQSKHERDGCKLRVPIDANEIAQTPDNSPILAYPRNEKEPVSCSAVDKVTDLRKKGKVVPLGKRFVLSKWPIEPGEEKPKQGKIDVDFGKPGEVEKLDRNWKFFTYSCENYDLGGAEPENRRNDPSVQ